MCVDAERFAIFVKDPIRDRGLEGACKLANLVLDGEVVKLETAAWLPGLVALMLLEKGVVDKYELAEYEVPTEGNAC